MFQLIFCEIKGIISPFHPNAFLVSLAIVTHSSSSLPCIKSVQIVAPFPFTTELEHYVITISATQKRKSSFQRRETLKETAGKWFDMCADWVYLNRTELIYKKTKQKEWSTAILPELNIWLVKWINLLTAIIIMLWFKLSSFAPLSKSFLSILCNCICIRFFLAIFWNNSV